MISIPPKISKQEGTIKIGFIPFIIEFLESIFALALINFSKKNSKYSVDKTFRDYNETKNKEYKNVFRDFIFQLSEEINSIKTYLDSNAEDKDFKAKDINMDIIILCINNCIRFCDTNMEIDELINELNKCLQELLKRKKIKSNSDSKKIISQLYFKLNCFSNNLNKIRGFNIEKKKSDDEQILQYKKQIGNPENKITEQESQLCSKETDRETENNINEKNTQAKTDKSTYEEIEKKLANYDKEIYSLKQEIKQIKDIDEKNSKKIRELESENNNLKHRLYLTEKKVENLQILLGKIREDMNKLISIEKDISSGLDEVCGIMDDLQSEMEIFRDDLMNLDFVFNP